MFVGTVRFCRASTVEKTSGNDCVLEQIFGRSFTRDILSVSTCHFSCLSRGDDYKNHNKCISEDQKYGGKGFEAKANKGEVKQQQWIEVIMTVVQDAFGALTFTEKTIARY